MTAYERIVEALRANGSHVIERGGDKAQAQCPVPGHGQGNGDLHPSLEIRPRRDGAGVVVRCHAGCNDVDVLAALKCTVRDLFDEPRIRNALNPNRSYRYPNGDTKIRRGTGPNKEVRWKRGHNGGNHLYGVEHLQPDDSTTYLAEGESAAEMLRAMGCAAVATGGCGRIDSCDLTPLAGRDMIVVVDRDPSGVHWADKADRLLGGIAKSVQFVQSAVRTTAADVVDHVAADLRLDELVPYYPPAPGAATTNHQPGQANPSPDAAPIPQPKLWRATDLKPVAQPCWLAKARIPRAAPSLIIGEEGIGKSLLWVWLAAVVSTGREVPGFGIPARAPGHVIIAAITEDDWCTAVRPRLEVAGADLAMIDVICTEQDGSGAPQFPRDMHLIRDADPRPDLVIVDAWLDTVAPDLSVRDPQQARQALHSWKELATTTDAAVVLICHTNRIATPNARDRYGSTVALRQKARMTLYCQTDDEGHLIVGPEKANGTATVPASLFAIGAVLKFQPTADDDGTVPRMVYVGETDQTARQHLAETYAAEHDAGKGSAAAWLGGYLSAGPRWVADINSGGEEAGYTVDQLKRAKPKLGVVSRNPGEPNAWYWALPQHRESAPPPVSCSLAPSLSPQVNRESTLPPPSDRESASTSGESERVHGDIREQDRSLATNGGTNFVPPSGPGRCPKCGFHVSIQGHRDDCPANNGDPDSQPPF